MVGRSLLNFRVIDDEGSLTFVIGSWIGFGRLVASKEALDEIRVPFLYYAWVHPMTAEFPNDRVPRRIQCSRPLHVPNLIYPDMGCMDE